MTRVGPTDEVCGGARNVRPGRDRSTTPFVWPVALVRPEPPTRVVYLDLNHWIGLAKANVGHRDGVRYRAALDSIRNADRRFVFPLSSVHYMEMHGIKDPRQRLDIATVMEEISGFTCLMSNLTIMELEIDAIVARLTGGVEHAQPIPLLGRGVLQAFGRQGGLTIQSEGNGDVTERTRKQWPGGPAAFDAWRESAERELDRAVLRGPSDHEVSKLEAYGWDPTVAKRIATERAQQEEEQAQRLAADSRWRRGRLRDVVAARYLVVDAHHTLQRVLGRRHVRLADLAGGDKEDARAFTDAMPSADTYISLLTASHSNPQTRWSSNSIFDMDALSVAVPYADVVLTEHHFAHVLEAARVPERVDTKVLTGPDELVVELTTHEGAGAR